MCAPGSPKPNCKTAMPGMLWPSRSACHIRSDDAQILGKKWQASQGITKLVEQIISGTIDPAAVNRCGLVRGNLPELGETAEVIKADVVAGLRGPAQTLDPPVVTLRRGWRPSCRADCPSAGRWR